MPKNETKHLSHFCNTKKKQKPDHFLTILNEHFQKKKVYTDDKNQTFIVLKLEMR